MRPDYDFSGGERGKFFHRIARRILPVSDAPRDWAGPDGQLGAYIAEESRKTVRAYAEQPHLVREHANHEHDTARGGYADRQLFELIQNGADALSGASDRGRIAIRLTEGCLYCADDGEPIDRAGVTALMFSHLSPKRGTSEIGRFGLGFKSVLGVTDAPEFFSRAGSFRFDRRRACERLRKVAPDVERCPVLRVADPVDPRKARDTDPVLRDLMDWATNVVRLPLNPGAGADLRHQMQSFPPEFLLFVEHVRQLSLEDGSTLSRMLELENADGESRLVDGEVVRHWKLFKIVHPLSDDARADRRALDDGDEVPIWWAAPIDRLTDPGRFWAYFPTKTASLVAGILNAPWKTNEDRQNLLPGPYNDELIDAAATMIADRLPALATEADPARHLDVLPRRHESGDSEQSGRLRERLLADVHGREVVPDQTGRLRGIPNINYAPEELTRGSAKEKTPLDRWAQYRGRPSNWLHHRALPRNRLARIDQLIERWESVNGPAPRSPRRASIAEWLDALVAGKPGDAAVEASRAALVTAAALPSDLRSPGTLGSIVLMQNGTWKPVDPDHVFLPRDVRDAEWSSNADELVHTSLASDTASRRALDELGICTVSAESYFGHAAARLLNDRSSDPELLNDRSSDPEWRQFWALARDVDLDRAYALIASQRCWRNYLRVRTQAGAWAPIHRVLLPGGIVPGPDGGERQAVVDIEFHADDEKLLDRLGATAEPTAQQELSAESWFRVFENDSRCRFKARDLPSQPHDNLLRFESTTGVGPLDVLDELSERSRVRYTDALLHLDATYEPWVMRHETRQDHYPEMKAASPAMSLLKKHGRIRTAGGVVPFADALGTPPKNPTARDVLLAHVKADKIRTAFNLSDPVPEFFGEEDAVPFDDVWPGFWRILEKFVDSCHELTHWKRFQLVRCERILVGNDALECVAHDFHIYLSDGGDGKHELQAVLQRFPGLDPGLDGFDQLPEAILRYAPPPDVEARRAAVRALPTDAERLLKAVTEPDLRRHLPASLVAILEEDSTHLDGVTVAEAAIATFHTDALRQCRDALEHLDPPRRWAGSPLAVDFVQSLGFSTEWAGERNVRRESFVEVEGPHSLPPLHDYQKRIVARVRSLLRDADNRAAHSTTGSTDRAVLREQRADSGSRRGMLSLPTGSGKTRVAVQSIIEAMCHDGFVGGVLWVADRDELCEQAVEAWTQVWSSVGADGKRLRISRMWARQPRPTTTNDLHVVVATIQTLRAKFHTHRNEYDFLTDFTLVVFDEAHRSVAPTFTSVMREIGLTRRRREDESFLIGLTATPYRGHDESETTRLVNRYGRRRLDAGAFSSDDPEKVVAELQHMQVLAQADHQTIDGGRFSLNAAELGQMRTEPKPPWLPRSVEDRIARDSARTNRIIEAYTRQVRDIDPNWTALVFATSVEHAKTIAALLGRTGVPSRAVSGETQPSTRRRIVEDFRRGELKVLVNYGVFREGFDAPRTRVIIVARPVYSPNLYFQMIGRGLRGARNGGTDRCLIINVQDNIENFEQRLAFTGLDWLWA